MDTTTDRSALEGKLIPELQQIAQRLGIEGSQKLRKAGLIDAIVEHGEGAMSGNGEARTTRTVEPDAGSRDGENADDRGSNGETRVEDVGNDGRTDGDAASLNRRIWRVLQTSQICRSHSRVATWPDGLCG